MWNCGPLGDEALSAKETDIIVIRGSSCETIQQVKQTALNEKKEEIAKNKTYKARVSKSVLTPTLSIWVMMRR